MHEVKINDLYHQERKVTVEYRADRPSHTGGRVMEEFVKNGTRYYNLEDGRLFDADTYDKMFNPPKGIILGKSEKMPLKGLWLGKGTVIPRSKSEKGVNRYVKTGKNKRKIA